MTCYNTRELQTVQGEGGKLPAPQITASIFCQQLELQPGEAPENSLGRTLLWLGFTSPTFHTGNISHSLQEK